MSLLDQKVWLDQAIPLDRRQAASIIAKVSEEKKVRRGISFMVKKC